MTPRLVGHRGTAGTHPENTRVSIESAINLGLKWVEVDIQPTKDNVLVVCHDHTIDRTSNGSGRIDELTLDELRTLDFGRWFKPCFACEPILTLAELLELAKQHQLSLNLEVKVDRHDAKVVAEQLKEQLTLANMDAERIILSSFSHDIMRQLHQHCQGFKLGALTEKLRPEDMQLLTEINAFSCHLNYRYLSKPDVEQLRQQGYQIWCYTVNDADAFPLINHVDAIFTDFPETVMT